MTGALIGVAIAGFMVGRLFEQILVLRDVAQVQNDPLFFEAANNGGDGRHGGTGT